MSEAARVPDDLFETLGHRFARPELLIEALTHASAVSRQPARGTSKQGYERLEFLGDRVLGLVGEDGARTREIPGVLADVCEAVIAALYLDGGIAAAERFIHRHWERLIEAGGAPPRDPKTALQEWAQARGHALPRYETVKIEGPAHERRFTVAASVADLAPESAAGTSKRAAEVAAAAALLARIAGADGERA